MSKDLLEYKKYLENNLVKYEDNKNLIMDNHNCTELHYIQLFEKETGISVEELQTDLEYKEWLQQKKKPLYKKIIEKVKLL